MSNSKFVPLKGYEKYTAEKMRQRSQAYYEEMRRRRSVRAFSDQPVPREVIEDSIHSAGTAPSGANQKPWHFVAISDSAVKKKNRTAAEKEEHEFYGHLAPDEWLEAIARWVQIPINPFGRSTLPDFHSF